MKTAILAVAAFAASAAAQLGSAKVINACSYAVTVANTPSAGGGYSEQDTSIQANKDWSQQWTSLTNGNGWAIKLSDPSDPSNLLQYEYTYSSGATDIWYDISEVNGDLTFGGDWYITGEGDCQPQQKSFLYPTDAGMQSNCTATNSITLILCYSKYTGSGAGASSVSSAASTMAPVSSTASAPVVSTTVPSPTSTPSTSSSTSEAISTTKSHHGAYTGIVDEAEVVATPTSTTLVTSAIASTANGDVVTVTEVTTAIAYHTVFPKERRGEHVHEHAAHHARHPHGARA